MRVYPTLALIASALIWGAAAPIMKLTLTQVPIFSLAFIRMSIASLVLGLLIYNKLKIRKKDRLTFFWAAITGVTLNLTFFFIGLKLTQAIVAAFLVASVPIFTIVAANLYLKEKLSMKLILASLVALVGVAIIAGKPQGFANFAQVLGNFLLLLATLSWVAHEIIAKKLLKIYDGATVVFYSMAIGTITFLPLSLGELLQNPSWVNNVNLEGLAGLLYGIFFASLLAYWLWQKGLSFLPAGQAAFFFYLDPISGAILSIILLGEKITTNLIIGGILIATGVYLAQAHAKTHPLHK